MDDSVKQYKNISRSTSYRSDPQPSNYLTNIMTICPTEDCKDCTGSISNDLFGHRFVCMCQCHLSVEKRVDMK